MLLVFWHRQRLMQSIVWPTPSPNTHAKLTHPAAQFLCYSWATCSIFVFALLEHTSVHLLCVCVCVEMRNRKTLRIRSWRESICHVFRNLSRQEKVDIHCLTLVTHTSVLLLHYLPCAQVEWWCTGGMVVHRWHGDAIALVIKSACVQFPTWHCCTTWASYSHRCSSVNKQYNLVLL